MNSGGLEETMVNNRGLGETIVNNAGESMIKTEVFEEEPGQNDSSNMLPCNLCPRSYSSTEGLRRHRITHTAEDGKPFACLACDKKYSRKDKLNLHVKNNHSQFLNVKSEETKERFGCDQCEKTFSRKDILQRHIKKYPYANAGSSFLL